MMLKMLLICASHLFGAVVVEPRPMPRVESVQIAPVVVRGLPITAEVAFVGPGDITPAGPLMSTSPLEFRFCRDGADAGKYVEFSKSSLNKVKANRMLPGEKSRVFVPAQALEDGARNTSTIEVTHLENSPEPGGNIPMDGPVLTPGSYRVVCVDKHGQPLPEPRDPVSVRVVAPNQMESRLLDQAMHNSSSTSPQWREFVLHFPKCIEGIEIDKLSEAGRRQMGYLFVLGRLVHENGPPGASTIYPEEWDALTDAQRTDVLILSYEIYVDRQDRVASQAVKKQILEQRPLALSQLEAIDQGKGGVISELKGVALERRTFGARPIKWPNARSTERALDSPSPPGN